MSLFEQQPMGPVPARRPIMQPPDPEREEELADQGPVEVQVLGPLPPELAQGSVAGRRPPPRRWLRALVAAVLLVPSLAQLGFGLASLVVPEVAFDERVRLPGLVVAVGVVVIVVAWLLHGRPRRPASGRRRR